MNELIRKSDALEIIRRNGIDNIFWGIPLETSKLYKEFEELQPVETLEDVLERLPKNQKLILEFTANYALIYSTYDCVMEWRWKTPLEAALALEEKLNPENSTFIE